MTRQRSRLIGLPRSLPPLRPLPPPIIILNVTAIVNKMPIVVVIVTKFPIISIHSVTKDDIAALLFDLASLL